MARVRVLLVVLVVGVLAIGAGTLQGADRGAGHPADAQRVAGVASAALGVAAWAGQADGISRRTSAAVPRLVSPRRSAGVHMTFPRAWRPVTLEVGSRVQRPPLRVFCAACPPGTVLEFDL